MLKLKVNNIDVEVEEGLTVLQACEQAGVEIPRFCTGSSSKSVPIFVKGVRYPSTIYNFRLIIYILL